ncbi:MAG TPA: GGDEF domain-containing protein [Mycobacteriales bacterium]|nr:GGDEF domain-containing protein [Mycobacteriales bacterium]
MDGRTASSLPPRVAEALAALAAELRAEASLELFRPPSGLMATFGARPPAPIVTTFGITAADGTVLGQLRIAAPRGAAIPPTLLDVVTATVLPLLATCIDLDNELLDAARRTVRSRLAAQTDALTGVGNRLAFDRALDEIVSGPVAIVVVDLDGLKVVNDTQGHAAGDALITAAAAALRGSSRSDDLVARLGGDEFGLVLPRTGRSDASAVVARLEAALTAAGVSASIGIAVTHDGTGVRATLASADADMYANKTRRRSTLPRQRRSVEDEHARGTVQAG